MEFAVKIKHYRQQNDWTQQVVAEKLGVSRKTISSWENGRSYPDIFMLVQLSDLYHVSLDDLLREDHEMIDNYKQEHVTNAKQDRTFVISYIINVVATLYFLCRSLVGTSWLNQLQPGWRMLAGVLVGLMSFNIYFLLSKVEWKKMSRSTKIGAVMTFIVVLAFLIKLDMVALPKSAYQFGVGVGHGFVIALSALSIVETIWLYQQFKKRRDY